jgi:hypothetical protein
MELIDRYVHEIGEHLPWNLRADVEAELCSLIMDSLEERARTAQQPADARLAEAVMREFGPPAEVAKRYLPEDQYLIGPRLYPAYKLVVKIALIAVAAVSGVLVLATTLSSALGHGASLDLLVLARRIWEVIWGIFINLAMVTLVFAIIERVRPRREARGPAWSPAMLPPVKDPDRLSQAGMVVQMYLILALAVLFNFYPEWIGMAIVDGRVHLTNFLLPTFFTYMPLVNIFWALDFALHLIVLRQGRWRRETRVAEFALGLYGAMILYLVIIGPPCFRLDVVVKGALKGVLALVLFGSAVRLYRLLTRRPFEPWRLAEGAAPRH